MTKSYPWLQTILICGLTILACTPALPQITPDNTLGAESSRLTPNETINGATSDRIDGGAARGSNLFHSFSEFNIDDGQRVYFGNPDGIQNILTRVTGGNGSSILGTLGVDGGANLFLLNPNGIIFGQNASLDLRGSFVGTTANAIGFGEQGFFSATDTTAPPLLIVNPSALLFTQLNGGAIANPRQILVQGDGQGTRTTTDLIDTPKGLRLGSNQTLALVGGDLVLAGGTLKSTGGRIELGSVGADSSVGLVPSANGWALDYEGVQNFRDIQLSQQATVDASGIGGGNVRVQGRRITLKEGSQIEASTLGFQPGGTLEVTSSESIEIDDSGSSGFTGLSTQVYTGANGKGGNINVKTGSLSLSDGAQIIASTYGFGDAGSVFVQAKDSVSVAGNSYIFSDVAAGAKGNGGNVNITAPTLSLTDGGQLSTSVNKTYNNLPGGEGIAGNVFVDVSGDVIVSGVKNGIPSGIFSSLETGAKGRGGSINVKTGSLSLNDSAQISANTFGFGDAGSVLVQAKDSVSVSNSYILSNVESGAKGNGGNINITAPTLSLIGGGQLSTFVREASNNLPAGEGIAGNVFIDVSGAITISGVKNGFSSGIFSYLGTGAKGRGGNINVKTDSLSLSDGAQISANTYGFGDAGSVFVQAKDSVSAAGNSYISSDVAAGAKGNGGNINITALKLSLTDVGLLSTSVREAFNNLPAGEGIAGSVFVDVSGDVIISGVKNGFSSGIFSYLGTGANGKGGNINVTTGSLSLSDGAQLTATTRGSGDAGSVLVQAKDFVSASNGYIFSNVESGAKGNGGNINITAPTLSLTDGGQLSAFVREASNNLPAGEGIAGNVFVDVSGDVTISGVKNGIPSGIFSYLGTGANGKGGNINVKTGSLSLSNGAQIYASTYGFGDAGNVLVQAKNFVSAAGNSYIFSDVAAGAKGNGGNVNITAPTLSLTDGGQLSTSVNKTYNNLPGGEGIAGNVFVDVSGDVIISGVKNGIPSGIFSSLETGAKGKGGSINVKISSLSLTDGALLDATTFGTGDAGSVIIDAHRVFLDGNNTTIYSIVETTGRGKGGDIRITTDLLSLTNGARITATTLKEGDAGNIQINATDSVTVSGTSSSNGYSSALSTDTITNSTGKGGDITVNTNVLRVSDGAVLDAGTENDRNGGNITVNARQVEAINGGQLLTSTSSSGNAGKITVNASDSVNVNGSDATFNDRVTKFGTTVANPEAASGFFVRSEASGIAGDIEVTSPKVNLNRQGKFIAESASGNGGNINLQASDFLLLRHGSQISTNAGTNQLGGDGGNITINSPFIIALSNENSDISANAYTGKGGIVDIRTESIFGIQARSLPTLYSDITASSQLGVSGQISITEPNVQPTQGLIELPASVLDASDKIAQTCPSGATEDRPLGEFVVTGRGSLPPNPLELLAGTTSLSPLASIDGEHNTNPPKTSSASALPPTSATAIVEAQGWVRTAAGKIALVAHSPQATPLATTVQATCPVSK